jgi:glycerol-3-phosphate dehydrogenase
MCVCVYSTNITLSSPVGTGLLDPATKDGRVVFFLPWERMTVAGTTDSASVITHSPAPADRDIEFILEEIRHYLSNEIHGACVCV